MLQKLTYNFNPSFKLPKAFLSPIILLFFVLLLITGCKNTDDGLKADCNIHAVRCVKQAGNFHISFDINPKPVRSMADVVFSVGIKEGNNPVADASIIIDLTMPGMYMGENKLVLKHVKDGFYEGKGVIVRCPSGQKLWKAEVMVERNGQKHSVSFLFETEERKLGSQEDWKAGRTEVTLWSIFSLKKLPAFLTS